MQIYIKRLTKMLSELGHIGFRENEGTSRLPYLPIFDEGRDYVRRCMQAAGLDTAVDAVGNLSGRLKGKSDKIIAIGSHIDTVPNGGMYDGSLGVLAGIECLHTLMQNGYDNNYTMEIIAFTEEEGNVVGGTFGSKCFTGQYQEESTLAKLSKHGLSEEDIRKSLRDKEKYKCYLEYHIEQGGILEAEKIPVGVVDGIVAIVRYLITVRGVANHSGSTPMYLRDDAMIKASKMISRVVDIAHDVDPVMTCTIGKLAAEPGVVNVIPDKVVFPVELRCMNTKAIKKVIHIFRDEFQDQNIEIENFFWQDETAMDASLQAILRSCCEKRGVAYKDMPSGAGHDAINMALFTPTAMLFIPSIGGISHSIREYSTTEDIETGSNILLDTIVETDMT